MPRKARFNLPGFPQHVIQRGNNREPCFFAKADYLRYLDDLNESATRYSCQVHAYVLMTNDVHLLMTSAVPYGISQTMQALNRELVLGCTVFKDRIEAVTNRQARLGQPGRPRLEGEPGDVI